MASTPNRDDWQPECVAKHLGPWLIQPEWFGEAGSAVKAGLWQPKEARKLPMTSGQTAMEAKTQGVSAEPLYYLDGSGLAVLAIDGPMMKGESKYGGANTLRIRRAVRTAARERDVKGIFFAIDSPGGTVAGTQELAQDVAEAGRQKPTFAHIDDLGASAAYWVASQTGRITASATSEIGSIGVVAVVEDTSGLAEKRGIKVHVVSTGPYKGAGVEGAPITGEQLGYMQDRVDAVHGHFLAAVSAGRDQPIAKVQEWANGKVWIADQAKSMGLIDEVSRMDDALNAARQAISDTATDTMARVEAAGKTFTVTAREPEMTSEDLRQREESRRFRVTAALARLKRQEEDLQALLAKRKPPEA